MSEQYAISWRDAAPIDHRLRGIVRRLARHAILSSASTLNHSCADRFLRPIYAHYVFADLRDNFEQIILALKKLGTFVDTPTCLEMLAGQREIDGRYFHLSFDDGFRNLYTEAVPVLKEHNVPAIFFVPSQLVDASWEQTSQYCLQTTSYNGVIETLRWADLKEMLSLGFEIGSHTRHHARFSAISRDPRLLEDEIAGSKRDIEEKLGVECAYIAWPYGGRKDADQASLEMVERSQYRACFGAFRGTVQPGKTSRWKIPRHHFEAEWPPSHVAYFARGNRELAT